MISKQNTHFIGSAFFTSEIVLSMVIAGIVKLLSPTLAIEVILVARYLFCLPLLFTFGLYAHGKQVMIIRNVGVLATRIIAGFLGLLFWFLAISRLDISTATVLLQTMVIFTTLLAATILNEKTTAKQWVAIFIGFLGTLILINPNRVGWDGIGVIYGLAAPISAAIMFVYLRKIGEKEKPISAALWYNIIGATSMCTWCNFFYTWKPIELSQCILLLFVGILASFQQATLALSHKFAQASILTPLNYLSIPLSILAGYFIFEDNLDFNFFIGTAAVLFSAYFITFHLPRKPKVAKAK